MNNYIKTLVYKLLENTIDDSELASLQLWLQDSKNFGIFKTYVEADYNLNLLYRHTEQGIAYQKLLVDIANQKKLVKRLRLNRIKYAAAILVGVLAGTYMFKDAIFNTPKQEIPIIVNNQIQPGTDKATLTLETGETITLEKGTSIQTQNASSNGEQIVYQQQSSSRAQSMDNILTIPRGGQFQLTLSDGTKVWLNSETQLKYPVSFTDGKSRQVELVYGEAYFDVSPSTEHKGSNFKVFNQNQEVEVLGTEFNIKAYKDETHIYTTLAEGKVAVHSQNKTYYLNPGQQSDLDEHMSSLKISNVDVKTETSWKDGVFRFKDGSLKEIMKVLSRWYDMEVIFENKDIENVKFKGILSKNQSIEEILSAIKSVSIKDYEIHGKTIILK